VSTKALVTLYAGPAQQARPVTWPAMERYADRYGYTISEATNRYPEAPITWAKVAALLDALSTHDVALWLDADCYVHDHAPDVLAELPGPCWQALAYDNRWGPVVANLAGAEFQEFFE
jgi:hypothetical protein